MSRCFSYPPPGFAGKSASGEALILSIKLQDGEKAKSERKSDKRREKKDKKEKKHKKHDKTPFAENQTFTEEKKRKLNHADTHQKHSKLHTQTKESSHDQTERSNLTEEHGKPCCSSESTENSGKRKRISVLPPTTNSIRSSGTVIRFRLSSQKRDDPPTPTSGNTAPCSTSGSDAALKIPIVPKTAIVTPKLEAPPCSLKEAPKPPSSLKEAPEPPSSTKEPKLIKEPKLPRPLRKYNSLFASWAPPQLEPETPNEEEDWLFSGKKALAGTSQPPSKRLKCCKEEAPIFETAAFQPRARLLGEADIYALPYTVPF